jgi:hypothetical protein
VEKQRGHPRKKDGRTPGVFGICEINADGKDEQSRDLGCGTDAVFRILARIEEVSGDEDRCEKNDPSANHPSTELGTDQSDEITGKGNQGEGADARRAFLDAFALETDEEADGKGEPGAEVGFGIHG